MAPNKLWAKIGEAAAEVGVSPAAIRAAVKEGFVKPSKNKTFNIPALRKHFVTVGISNRADAKESSGDPLRSAAARANAKQGNATRKKRADDKTDDEELGDLSLARARAKLALDQVGALQKAGEAVLIGPAEEVFVQLLGELREIIRSAPRTYLSILLEAGMPNAAAKKALEQISAGLIDEIQNANLEDRVIPDMIRISKADGK